MSSSGWEEGIELKRVCLGMTAPPSAKSAEGWGTQGLFFDLKGDIENLLHPFQCKSLAYDAQAAPYYHPGRAARAVMDGVTVAQFGQIDAEIARPASCGRRSGSRSCISTSFTSMDCARSATRRCRAIRR